MHEVSILPWIWERSGKLLEKIRRHPEIANKIAAQKLTTSFQKLVEPFKLQPPSSYYCIPRFLKQIEASLLSQQCGLLLLHAPPGCGKSTFARQAVRNLQKEKEIEGAVLVNSKKIADFCIVSNHPDATALNLGSYIRAGAGIPDGDTPQSLKNSLVAHFGDHPSTPKPSERVVILFDQGDHLYDLDKKRVDGFLTSLAEESTNTKAFVVLLTVSSSTLWERISKLNGNEKNVTIFENDGDMYWTDDEIKSMLLRHEKHDVNFNPTAEEREAMVQDANGRPRYIISAKDSWIKQNTA